MDSIQKVMQYFSDQRKYPEVQRGYFGTLIENFECDKTFFTSVEVTAGSRYVVVWLDKTGVDWFIWLSYLLIGIALQLVNLCC